jgi:DNA-binding response OmpR family regulator
MRSTGPILLVDSSKVAMMFQETVLRRADNVIHTASSGTEAWQKILLLQPQLVIFSYDLVDMTGPELCRQVRANETTRHTSLLFISDRNSEAHTDLCLAAGCNDLLARPFHRRELDGKVEKLTSIPTRRELRTLTKLEVSVQNEGFFLLGHSLNISANGMLLQVEHLLPPEARVRLTFFLPGEALPLNLDALVIRAEFNGATPRYGMGFAEISSEARERIEHYVQRVRSREHL